MTSIAFKVTCRRDSRRFMLHALASLYMLMALVPFLILNSFRVIQFTIIFRHLSCEKMKSPDISIVMFLKFF